MVVPSSAKVSSHAQNNACSVAVEPSPRLIFIPEIDGIPALDDTFRFISIILSSTDNVDVLIIVSVPSTVRFPVTRNVLAVSVVPSKVKFDDPAKLPEALYCT